MEETLRVESEEVRRRVTLIRGREEHAARHLGPGAADVVLCHGVIMCLADLAPLVQALVELARPAAVISLLAKNAAALAMRPALQGRWAEAVEAFGADRDVGGLGVEQGEIRWRGSRPSLRFKELGWSSGTGGES